MRGCERKLLWHSNLEEVISTTHMNDEMENWKIKKNAYHALGVKRSLSWPTSRLHSRVSGQKARTRLKCLLHIQPCVVYKTKPNIIIYVATHNLIPRCFGAHHLLVGGNGRWHQGKVGRRVEGTSVTRHWRRHRAPAGDPPRMVPPMRWSCCSS